VLINVSRLIKLSIKIVNDLLIRLIEGDTYRRMLHFINSNSFFWGTQPLHVAYHVKALPHFHLTVFHNTL
jgi:hypothetical protein